MPPNMPTGWNIPQWLQMTSIIAAFTTPFAIFVLAFVLKDRRQMKAAEDTSLATGQASFIDKILKAAEMAPELLAKNEDLMNVNAEYRAIIKVMEAEIQKLKDKVEALERDRDSWRDMALRVPRLEEQVATYDKMLREKDVALETVRLERDNSARELTRLREEIGAGRLVGGRRVTDPADTMVQLGTAAHEQEEP